MMQLAAASLRALAPRVAPPAACTGAARRAFNTGQDVKAETEAFVYRSSMTDPEVSFVDPVGTSSAVPSPAPLDGVGATDRDSYAPRWLRRVPNSAQPMPKPIGGLPDSDPAYKTENDAKDF